MKKLLTNIKKENIDYETFFKNHITEKKAYDFLRENEIDYRTATQYLAEFVMFNENPQNYNLIFEYGNVILQRAKENINEGLYYISHEYFQENKKLENIDYKSNVSKMEVVHEFLTNSNKGMYLCSNNGVGKTTLLVALSNTYHKMSGKKTLFVFWPDFIKRTKDFDKDSAYIINKVMYSSRLIIDDLGQESITKWARDDILHPIISYRLEKKLPTFITSNYTIKELEQIYTFREVESKKTKSILEKLKTLSKEYMLSGANLRSQNNEEK